MNIEKKQLSIILLSLYLLGIIASAFALFNLKDDLIYDLNVLAISDVAAADPAFNRTYLIVGAAMVLGLFAIYFSFKTDEANVIYVEKSQEEARKEAEQADIESRKDDKINKQEITNLIKGDPFLSDNLHKILSHICRTTEASQGAVYLRENDGNKRTIVLKASYAMTIAESEKIAFEFGEGLVGQVAKERKTIYLNEVPKGFVKVVSGLGEASPSYLLIIPILADNDLIGVVEISSFVPFRKNDIKTLEDFFSSLGANRVEKKSATRVQKEKVTADEAMPTEAKPTQKKKRKKPEDQ